MPSHLHCQRDPEGPYSLSATELPDLGVPQIHRHWKVIFVCELDLLLCDLRAEAKIHAQRLGKGESNLGEDKPDDFLAPLVSRGPVVSGGWGGG